jgi:hypothetical protein
MLWFAQGWNGGDGWIPSGDVVCVTPAFYNNKILSN